jgi:hypothetical protein
MLGTSGGKGKDGGASGLYHQKKKVKKGKGKKKG